MRLLGILVAAVVVAPVVQTAEAAAPKDPYSRGQWTKLVKDKMVQKRLNLTEGQIKTLTALKFAKDDNRAKIGETLKPEQAKTLKRLSWKRLGGYALFDDEVSDALKITKEQQAKLEAAAKTNVAEHRKMRGFLRRARFRSREAMQKYIAGFRDKADARLLAVLTKGQKAELTKLTGGKAA